VIKHVLGVCLMAAGMINTMAGQDSTMPVWRPGISVEMATASHAAAIPEADSLDATVVAVTAVGKIYVGTKPVEVSALAGLPAPTVYVKADARAPYQQVLTVLEALHGHATVLVTAPPVKPEPVTIAQPYGIRVAVGGTRAE